MSPPFVASAFGTIRGVSAGFWHWFWHWRELATSEPPPIVSGVTGTHVTLTLAGASLDIAGACLVAANELAPRVRAARLRLERSFNALRERARVLLRKPKHVTIQVGAAALSVSAGGSVSAIVDIDPAADTERRLAFLLTRAREAQERMNAFEGRIDDAVATLREELVSQRDELLGAFNERLEKADVRYIHARLVGILLVAAGGVLQAAANLVA